MTFAPSSVEDFLDWYKMESQGTSKVLGNITDKALAQEVAGGYRTLGRAAWHIVTTYPEMAGQMGIKIDSVSDKDPIPASATQIKAAYDKAAESLVEQVKSKWNDKMLSEDLEMYGMTMPRGNWLRGFVCHEIHHRAQMTVLMRQAGLQVPGVYGPSKEEWKGMGMQPPEV